MKATIDSGAVDTVAPRDAAQAVALDETEASKSGMYHTAANGTRIKADGEKHAWMV